MSARRETISFSKLARQITIVENELDGHLQILQLLNSNFTTPVIGITGPPGSGKSTLVNALIKTLIQQQKKIGVIAVDPSSPFNYGALLGDRVRMNEFFNNENVFIRSVASRGSLGGLSDKIIEITDVMRAANFDFIFVETVGVGQSEVEIAGLADITVVVLNPSSGDDVQMIKAGILEIANIFVINKADLSGANNLEQFLIKLVSSTSSLTNIPILKTTAINNEGIVELFTSINQEHSKNKNIERKAMLLTNKLLHLIQKKQIRNINKKALTEYVSNNVKNGRFNLYKFLNSFN